MLTRLKTVSSRATMAVQRFMQMEASGGIMLMGAAVLALIVANSALAPLYQSILAIPLGFESEVLTLRKPLVLWINDGLMALFFLLVALELKREIVDGQLSDRSQIVLPVLAALGGMAVPGLVYWAVNIGEPQNMRGWAIPAATDIAFALGVLTLLGKRVPLALKVLLTTVAVVDDLGAIIIIAVFYTANLATTPLMLALAALAVLIAMNRLGVRRILPYLVVGAFMWLCVLKSGVHATLAGVALGLCIPMRSSNGAINDSNPLSTMEHALHPWVAYFIVPVFAFANAGLSLQGLSFAALADPLPLGIVLGLVIGKQIGIFGSCAMLIRMGIVRMPPGVNYAQLYGMSLIAGIGFTMSLFIGSLAFRDPYLQNEVRLGVLTGSLISMVLGYLVLRFATRSAKEAAS